MTWSNYIHNPTTGPKMYLEKVPLNSMGYTSSGKYFGQVRGTGIWRYDAEEPSKYDVRPGYVRATSRADAKAKVREKYPNARFF